MRKFQNLSNLKNILKIFNWQFFFIQLAKRIVIRNWTSPYLFYSDFFHNERVRTAIFEINRNENKALVKSSTKRKLDSVTNWRRVGDDVQGRQPLIDIPIFYFDSIFFI